MKKKIVQVAISVLLAFMLVPISVSACGGFVAIKGEKVFHSIYCDSLYGLELSKLRWFDTAKKAESYGLSMCTECAQFYDKEYSDEYCESYWISTDHLLATAMELSFWDGNEGGIEFGKESMLEEVHYQFERGYEKGYEDGRYDGRIKAEQEAESQKAAAKEAREQSWYGLLGTIGFLLAIPYIISLLDNRKRK